MLYRNDENCKLMFICDFCESTPKKSISIRDNMNMRILADNAKFRGWFMRPKVFGKMHEEWCHCCYVCANERHDGKDRARLLEIAEPKYVDRYLAGQATFNNRGATHVKEAYPDLYPD